MKKVLMFLILLFLILFVVPELVESGLWSGILVVIVVGSALRDYSKKKKKRKTNTKKKSFKANNYKSSKINRSFSTNKNNSLDVLTDFEIDTNDYQNNYKYKSEPINQTEKFLADKKKLTRLRQMKTLKVENNNSENNHINKLFYLQASFMDDFIDDYDINVPCKQYTPTYNVLNMYQLRSFFSWRTLVRQGIYKETELSYVYLYIYELINKIGVKNEIDGLNKLIELWHNYRKFDNSIDYYLLIWLKDYYVINQIKIDYKQVEDEYPVKNFNNSNIISEIMQGNYNNKLGFYDSISSYHILKSKLMEHKYSFLVELIIPVIFKNLGKYFAENNFSLNQILFGEVKRSTWLPFNRAIYYDNYLTSDFQFIINDCEKYYKIKHNYYKETFAISDLSKVLMGYILKNIDIVLRDCLKVPGNLKANISMLEPIAQKDKKIYDFLINEKIVAIINTTIKKYLIEHKQDINNIINEERKKEIVIDENKFASIRESSSRVQEKLIIEEEETSVPKKEEIIDEPITNVSNNIFENLLINLNEIERDFVKMIISSETKDNLITFCQNNHILYEIMLENINSKALETIGDNLIEDCDTEVIIYAEYIDEIKENIGGN